MDNNSIAQQLYDFLNDYNLIQSELTTEENLNRIAQVLDQLNENENILTGFISKINEPNNPEKALLLTDSNRIIISPKEEGDFVFIDTDQIQSIDYEASPTLNKLIIKTLSEPVEILTNNEEGIEAINDALYSALSEIKTPQDVNRIFNLEPDTVIEEVIEEKEPETEEKTDFSDLTQPIDSFSGSVYDTIPDNTISSDYSEPYAFESSETSEKTESTNKDYFNIFNHQVKKSTAYIVGGIGVLVIAALIFFIASSFSGQSRGNREAKQLVGIFNEIDDIYFSAVDYEEKPDGVTAEDWQKLDNSAIDIQNNLNDFSTNDVSDSLYQAIYFYNDSLMTALYYGQSFATTGNDLQKNTLNQRLQSAYQNRLAVINILSKDFPDLLKLVNHGSSADDTIDDLLSESNSNGSDLLNKENSMSSDESRENSLTSDEIIDYSKYSNN